MADKLQTVTTVTALPDLNRTVGLTGGLLMGLVLTAGPIGWKTGFLVWQPPRTRQEWQHVASLSLRLLILPSIPEEFFWRVLLQPRPPLSYDTDLAFCVVSVAFYVMAHPVAAYTFWPRGRTLFATWPFLISSALLGSACTTAYQISASVWPAVFLHWVSIVAWIGFGGGEAKLLSSSSSSRYSSLEQITYETNNQCDKSIRVKK